MNLKDRITNTLVAGYSYMMNTAEGRIPKKIYDVSNGIIKIHLSEYLVDRKTAYTLSDFEPIEFVGDIPESCRRHDDRYAYKKGYCVDCYHIMF